MSAIDNLLTPTGGCRVITPDLSVHWFADAEDRTCICGARTKGDDDE